MAVTHEQSLSVAGFLTGSAKPSYVTGSLITGAGRWLLRVTWREFHYFLMLLIPSIILYCYQPFMTSLALVDLKSPSVEWSPEKIEHGD